jgi:hypothetical protein
LYHKHEFNEKSKCVLLAAEGFLIVARSGEKGSQKYVRRNRGGSDCSLVAWILGLPRFQRAHSRPVGNWHSDAPLALLQRQISHSVNDGTPEGEFSVCSYRMASHRSSDAIR